MSLFERLLDKHAASLPPHRVPPKQLCVRAAGYHFDDFRDDVFEDWAWYINDSALALREWIQIKEIIDFCCKRLHMRCDALVESFRQAAENADPDSLGHLKSYASNSLRWIVHAYFLNLRDVIGDQCEDASHVNKMFAIDDLRKYADRCLSAGLNDLEAARLRACLPKNTSRDAYESIYNETEPGLKDKKGVPTPVVMLRGLGEKPVVFKNEKPLLTPIQYRVVELLLEAGAERILLGEIQEVNSDARNILVRLRERDKDWERAILMPGGIKGKGYGILHE